MLETSPKTPERLTFPGIQVAIDRGGTFCDVIARVDGREEVVFKLLSENPQEYRDAPTEALRRILSEIEQREIPRNQKLDGSRICFKDVCVIGDQTRPKLFDLRVAKSPALHDTVIEIDERVTVEDYDLNPHSVDRKALLDGPDVFETASGELIRIVKRPSEELIRMQLQSLRNAGYSSLAVCLMHAWAFPDHEQLVASIAKSIGFARITCSSELCPQIKLLSRSQAVCSEAYLLPVVRQYVQGFLDGFSALPEKVEFMCSDGGLRQAHRFGGNEALLSGPAGGVVGVAQSCFDNDRRTPLIGFDMGGTSTDVCRYDGEYDYLSETKIADRSITATILNIATVAAGGGSVLSLRNGLLVVGPESAGAYPGPACYRNGGPLTVTDANLFLGRLVASEFPSIFGKAANEALDGDVVQRRFGELAAEYEVQTGRKIMPEDLASGFLDVANEAMSRPIRNATEARGYAPEQHHLVSFGGAGGQHACAVAEKLGIGRILIHKFSSLLSAYGISQARLQHEAAEPCTTSWSLAELPQLEARLARLRQQVQEELVAQGSASDAIDFKESLSLRYFGTDTTLDIPRPNDNDYGAAFSAAHLREFAFRMDRKIVVDGAKVRGEGSSRKGNGTPSALDSEKSLQVCGGGSEPSGAFRQDLFVGGRWHDVGAYRLDDLAPGSSIEGPAVLLDQTQTIVVDSMWTASKFADRVVLSRTKQAVQRAAHMDPIQLSVFAHRFMAIAEQMGNTLQRTSISTSIRERLDFSCAIFSPDGKLVANAPHIPIHLGSMQFAIQAQHRHWQGKLKAGDVLLTNHPEWGGTHLPDLTVVTPCFVEDQIAFYVASRGHHTDIGGRGITSMMPESKELWEEGISVPTMRIASGGTFLEDEVRAAFVAAGEHPGCAPTRRIGDNISDLKAQMSANQRGITLLGKMCAESGLPFVHEAMHGIQSNAETSVRSFLKAFAAKHPEPLSATDFYDDGTPVSVRVTISPTTGDASYDFSDTGWQIWGNFNSPISITHSAVIYTLRCLIDLDIPLNEGCLTPVTIHVPKNSILNPGPGVAICGSTIASQRVIDVIFKAFGVCAAFQGCANSFGWGMGGRDPVSGKVTPGWNSGEAIGGGCGAGPGWNGEHAAQVHSTNTRMTDPEIIEKRTQVLVRKSVIREGSGGDGEWRGGDGVTREIEARMPLKFSILSDRRVFAPYGMEGGQDGAPGLNLLYRHDGRGGYTTINLGGKAVANLEAGEYIQINTPGGGGWGHSKARTV